MVKWNSYRLSEVADLVKDKPIEYDGKKNYYSTGDIANEAEFTFKKVECYFVDII